jgi:hypothetical protein
MKLLPLTNGQFTKVDDDIYEQAKHYTWRVSERGYVNRNEMKKGRVQKTIYLHKLVCPSPKGMKTDHHNGDKLDNQRSNLRVCTQRQNTQNKSRQSNAQSVYKGIYPHSENGTWIAQIKVKNKQVYLGSFPDEHTAGLAYDLWAKDLYGEFAKLNFQSLD